MSFFPLAKNLFKVDFENTTTSLDIAVVTWLLALNNYLLTAFILSNMAGVAVLKHFINVIL